MTTMDVIDWIIRSLAVLGLPGAVIYFIRDRRKNVAESKVAERTVGATVAKADLGALEAHMLAVEKAFTMERESKDRQIANMERQLCRAEETIKELRVEIASLRGRVEDLSAEKAAEKRRR